MYSVFDAALDMLIEHPGADPAMRLNIAVQYNIALSRFEDDFQVLLQGPWSSIPPQSLFPLGPHFLRDLINARGQLQGDRIYAALPIEFAPSPDCTDPCACAKVWQKIWSRNFKYAKCLCSMYIYLLSYTAPRYSGACFVTTTSPLHNSPIPCVSLQMPPKWPRVAVQAQLW